MPERKNDIVFFSFIPKSFECPTHRQLLIRNCTNVEVIQLNPDSELASLGLYVTLASLDKDVDAIEEMKRFLKSHPAKLYKDTLEELLDGLTKGFMTNYKDDIITLAKSNGFKI